MNNMEKLAALRYKRRQLIAIQNGVQALRDVKQISRCAVVTVNSLEELYKAMVHDPLPYADDTEQIIYAPTDAFDAELDRLIDELDDEIKTLIAQIKGDTE